MFGEDPRTFVVEFDRQSREVVAPRSLKQLKDAVRQEFGVEDNTDLLLVAIDGQKEVELWSNNLISTLDETTKIVAYSNCKNPCAIRFGPREYSLDVIPPSDTILVRIAKEVVIPEFNVPNFVGNLRIFVNCVRLTHIHLLASGHLELAMNLHELGSSGLKPLSDKSSLTLGMFATTSRDILDTFRTVFEHCLDRLDKQALINLECLTKKAVGVKAKASEIIVDLNEQLKCSQALLKETAGKWSTKGNEAGEKATKIKETEHAIGGVQEKMETDLTTLTESTEADKRYRQLNEEVNFFKWIGWKIRYKFNKCPTANTSYGRWVESWDRRVETAQEAAKAKSRKEPLAHEKKELERKLEKTKKEDEEIKKLVSYLGQAISAIKNALITMQAMYMFWTKMEFAIGQLTENEAFIECLKSANSDDRKRLLRSRAFKRQGVLYMARCVAIRDISLQAGAGMREINIDMEDFLRETPNQEQAATMLADREFVSRLEGNPLSTSAIPSAPLKLSIEEEEIRTSFQQPSEQWLELSVEVSHEELGEHDSL